MGNLPEDTQPGWGGPVTSQPRGRVIRGEGAGGTVWTPQGRAWWSQHGGKLLGVSSEQGRKVKSPLLLGPVAPAWAKASRALRSLPVRPPRVHMVGGAWPGAPVSPSPSRWKGSSHPPWCCGRGNRRGLGGELPSAHSLPGPWSGGQGCHRRPRRP